ncbi:protein hairy-like [Palaemon carinicauda]|uniref:protein hairy-like n=1 Tax=Palaemon carinicauda TaxID=392227 RepID=UPI0035B5BCBB
MGVQQQPALVNKSKTTKPMSEARKIRKPLMERKRRERINTCLNDLAALLVDAKMVKSEPGKPTKLEKADILELTVKHIKSFKSQDDNPSQLKAETEDKKASSYKDGFTKCMGMVDQTLGKAGKEALRQRLLSHLKNCLKTLDPPTKEPTPESNSSLTVASEEALESDTSETDGSVTSSDSETEREDDKKIDSQRVETEAKETPPRITLVPTRLPSGGMAFVIQGSIDPSLLLPQNDNSSKDVIDNKAASPPPSTATCDSSTSPATPLSRPDYIPTPSTSSATPPPCAFSPVTTSYIPSPQPSADNYSHAQSSSTCQSSAVKPVHNEYPVVHTYHTAPPCAPSAVYPEFQCPSSTPYNVLCTSTPPAPTYCSPESPNQEDHSSSNGLHVPTTSYHILNVPSQPHSIPHHPAFSRHSHNPPTPPPSISPQNILPVHQYQHYQPVSSEEDMDTDGLSEEEVDIDVENDVPYDLSMRRIWRFW